MSDLPSDMRLWTERLPVMFPDFRPTYEAFVAANGGELLPTLVWAEFATFVSGILRSSTEPQSHRRIADFLEEAASARPEVANLVQTGFMEQLDDDAARRIIHHLHPRSRTLLEKSRRY